MTDSDAAAAYEQSQLTAIRAWEQPLAEAAAQHVDDGLSAAEVVADIEGMTDHTHVWVPLVSGKPTQAAVERAQAGALILAGCAMFANAPHEQCRVCGEQR